MKTQAGKINWVLFDFNFTGDYFPDKDETSFHSTRISNVVISDDIIKFSTEPYDVGKGKISTIYNANLFISNDGKKYEGVFNEIDDFSQVECTCELFENTRSYLLCGKWTEYFFEDESESVSTWWAKIDKHR